MACAVLNTFSDSLSPGIVLLLSLLLLLLHYLKVLYEFRSMPPGQRLTAFPVIGNVFSLNTKRAKVTDAFQRLVNSILLSVRYLSPLMSRIECKYCLISTSGSTELFAIFHVSVLYLVELCSLSTTTFTNIRLRQITVNHALKRILVFYIYCNIASNRKARTLQFNSTAHARMHSY